MLPFAIISITLALVLYSAGVWGERLSKNLRGWHVIIFWCGLVFDMIGTTLMGQIAGSFSFNLHSVTGVIAILLMLVHAIWATIVLFKGSERAKANFHKFSIVVWAIWLIPYFTGMFLGMGR
ncbi:HsmA family protein [Culicoidibacter larvae]|uniref:TIGR03987 family protein n=1 Tax=Culicoidibacter larvae TaxID=2579976 RepID=A0A5R8QCJ7_9FIRM|nr:HsmA family protein [Culicoidibacter larvae]TLG74228.1 TIGR03987 family protein [Culicoidibacter larvae]